MFDWANKSARRFKSQLKYKRGKRKNKLSDPMLLSEGNGIIVIRHPLKSIQGAICHCILHNEHHNWNDNSIWDPKDEQDIRYKKDPHKRRIYCFEATIQNNHPVDKPTWQALYQIQCGHLSTEERT
jgi:hypothetical protein